MLVRFAATWKLKNGGSYWDPQAPIKMWKPCENPQVWEPNLSDVLTRKARRMGTTLFFFVNRCLQNPTTKPVSCSIASMRRLWLHSGIAQKWSAKGPQICFSLVATIPRIYKYCCWTRKTHKVHPSGTSTVAAQQGIAPTYHISSGQQSGKRSMGSFNLSHSWSNPQVELASCLRPFCPHQLLQENSCPSNVKGSIIHTLYRRSPGMLWCIL